MNTSLIDFPMDNYFLVGNFLFQLARIHDPEVTPDRVGYVVELSKATSVFYVVRQGNRVAEIIVDDNQKIKLVYYRYDWADQFKAWVEKAKNLIGLTEE